MIYFAKKNSKKYHKSIGNPTQRRISSLTIMNFEQNRPASDIRQANLINKIMFLICLAATILLLVLACALHFCHMEFLDLIHFPCVILRYTGYPCPGCGMTRSISALLQGHLGKSFLYHPAVLCAILLDLCTLGGRFFCLTTGKKEGYFHFRMMYLYLLIAVILLQWILKLI